MSAGRRASSGSCSVGGARALVLLAAGLLVATTSSPATAMSLVDSDALTLDLGGDVKAFFVSVFLYEHPLFLEDPQAVGQGAVNFRLKLEGEVGGWLSFEVHHQMEALTQSFALQTELGVSTTGARGTPEAVDLSWEVTEEEQCEVTEEEQGCGEHHVRGRIDRLSLTFHVPHVDVTVGRQPVTFGTTFFFTPTDLVAPFSPTTIDREYKPGIDAVRADAYFGTSATLTVVGAYAEDWNLAGSILAGSILAARGGFTVDVWDLGLFLGAVQEDLVLGVDAQGSVGPVSVRAEVTGTLPAEDVDPESPFMRAVVGASHSWPWGLSLSGELYVQTLGALDSYDYLVIGLGERVSRGELWALGRYYAGASASYELTPIIYLGLFSIVNLHDPSALVGPSLTWAVGDEAELNLGAYLGVGKRPAEMLTVDGLDLGSELGVAPPTAFLALKAYF